ncbi:MAG: FHA domain-containing protein [Acidimicrobiia bacterium]|nr:FHA domain-containing protein [Acidimicrobiia bacterium]
MRRLERRLEAVLERTAGSLFRGEPHVTELAGSVVRVLDLSVDSDGLVPNRILIPAGAPAESLHLIESAISEAIMERGWRVEGPVTVVPSDVRTVTVTVDRGPLPPWAHLVGESVQVPVTVNRAVIGRSSECDTVLDDNSVSRRHALLWRQDARILVRDLGSSNGTFADDTAVTSVPTEVGDGSMLGFGATRFRLRTVKRA